MTDPQPSSNLSAAEHAQAMEGYIRDGEERAHALGNRGPIKLDDNGKLDAGIVDAYWRHGFYVFENVITPLELGELRADVARALAAAPPSPDDGREARGKPVNGLEFTKPSFRYAKPLSDPVGGTTMNKGRHPVKMLDPTPSDDAPDLVSATLSNLLSTARILAASSLRLNGFTI